VKAFAVLISGDGSNLQAIIDACERGEVDGRLALVLSNSEKAYGLTRARVAGIPHQAVDHRAYPCREDYERVLIQLLEEAGVELIVLAGFMRIFSPLFVHHYRDRILNIHPSLLPAFRGINALQQALDAGVRNTGVTVHFVTEGLDAGPIIAQRVVELDPDDSLEETTEKIHSAEHALYPQVIHWVLSERVHLIDGCVVMQGEDSE
jgi:phosphoribosylglycinamide formyltransferase-1